MGIFFFPPFQVSAARSQNQAGWEETGSELSVFWLFWCFFWCSRRRRLPQASRTTSGLRKKRFFLFFFRFFYIKSSESLPSCGERERKSGGKRAKGNFGRIWGFAIYPGLLPSQRNPRGQRARRKKWRIPQSHGLLWRFFRDQSVKKKGF